MSITAVRTNFVVDSTLDESKHATRRQVVTGGDRTRLEDPAQIAAAEVFTTGVDHLGVGWQKTSADTWTSTEHGDVSQGAVPNYMTFPLTAWW